MSILRIVPILLWSNQLHRLLFASSPFPGGRSSRLLQFPQMDSLVTSANSHSGARTEILHNRDHSSDMIMVGSMPVYLYSEGYEKKSLSPLSVNKCDDFKLGKRTPANAPSSYHDDEFQPVSRQIAKRRSWIDLELERSINTSSFLVEGSPLLNNIQLDELSLPNQFGKKNEPFYVQKRRSMDSGSKNSLATENSRPFEPFDICPYKRRGNAEPGARWQVKGRDTVKDMEHAAETTNYRVLRPGMILLKHYITLREQVNIVKTCQELGLGAGGFYRPGYKDGAKLRLQMMCLGLDWDPQTRKYGDIRAVDGDKPPDIPRKFAILVREALKDAHALIKNKCNKNNIESILPSISPDICIVNFYTTSGRLGLHQDRDESEESLVSGLPVVSFSVGNSAEFLYGDQRDVDKAEKVVLESGDVLIFGGESRHIFHGVSSIIPKSTPRFLLDHTGLRPGRLNLTFRKY